MSDKKESEIVCGVKINGLLNSYTNCKAYFEEMNTPLEKAGAVKSFELTLELSWKVMRKFLEANGFVLEIKTPKAIFRKAADVGLISKPYDWFEYIRIRNITAHTYDEGCIDKVLRELEGFQRSVEELIENLRKLDAKFGS